jgi:Fe-S-cluster containining protein
MTAGKARNCDGCSACCASVGQPPFLLAFDGGVTIPVGGADSEADQQRLLAAPAEAQAAYRASHGNLSGPCAWLDALDNRGRYYEFRPDICRTFEIGGKWCSQFRELHQIR